MLARLVGRISPQSTLAAGYLVWAGVFIASSSFVGIDHQRYFSLADDAMISMRYAWNLAHGNGLVWNSGERVEGYTNLLHTLSMASASTLFEKRFAVLAIQVVGALTMIAVAGATGRLAEELVAPRRPDFAPLARGAGFLCGLAYFPVSHWTLMGMETGLVFLLQLLALLNSMALCKTGSSRSGLLASSFGGLAYLARPDSLVLSGPLVVANVVVWLIRHPNRRWVGGLMLITFLALPLAQSIYRWLWYETLLPNTYVLKVEGIPFSLRIARGWIFIRRFLDETWPVHVSALASLLLVWDRRRLVVGGWIVAMLAYQVYVGGDAWFLWRMVPTVIPLSLVLVASGLLAWMPGEWPKREPGERGQPVWARLLHSNAWHRTTSAIEKWGPISMFLAAILATTVALVADPIGISDAGFGDEQRYLIFGAFLLVACAALSQHRPWIATAVLAAVVGLACAANRPFQGGVSLWGRPDGVEENEWNVNTALAINAVTTPGATIGVFYGGALPYYADRYAIDFLGKSDVYIAHLVPDLPPESGRAGISTRPGHNKYDLEYSIEVLQPTFVQGFVWGQDNLTAYSLEHYSAVRYNGLLLYFLRDAPTVRWELVRIVGPD